MRSNIDSRASPGVHSLAAWGSIWGGLRPAFEVDSRPIDDAASSQFSQRRWSVRKAFGLPGGQTWSPMAEISTEAPQLEHLMVGSNSSMSVAMMPVVALGSSPGALREAEGWNHEHDCRRPSMLAVVANRGPSSERKRFSPGPTLTATGTVSDSKITSRKTQMIAVRCYSRCCINVGGHGMPVPEIQGFFRRHKENNE